MAKYMVVGNILHVFVDFGYLEYNKAIRYDPEAATVFEQKDDMKVPVFKVAVGKSSLSEYGATFDAVRFVGNPDADDYKVPFQLAVELPNPMKKEEMGSYIADEYGNALHYLCVAENQIKEAVEKYDLRVNEVLDKVEVVDVNVESTVAE